MGTHIIRESLGRTGLVVEQVVCTNKVNQPLGEIVSALFLTTAQQNEVNGLGEKK